MTELNESKKLQNKKKDGPVRFNTEINEISDNYMEMKPSLKKKKLIRKKTENFIGSSSMNKGMKYYRKSL